MNKRQRYQIQGFWHAAWKNRRQIPSWDIVAAFVLAVCAWFGLDDRTIALGLEPLLQAEVSALGTLLGLVIAGLAILVAFLSRDWIAVLIRASNGIQGDFFPFWYVAGLTTSALTFAGAGLILRLQATPLQSRVIATGSIFLTLYAVFSALNLVAFIVHQGGNRATQLLLEEEQGDDR